MEMHLIFLKSRGGLILNWRKILKKDFFRTQRRGISFKLASNFIKWLVNFSGRIRVTGRITTQPDYGSTLLLTSPLALPGLPLVGVYEFCHAS